jgi:hypothetical protein
LLFGDVCFEPGEHGVERVGQFAELVFAAFQLDPVGQRSVPGQAGGVCDADQRREHATGEDPSAHEAEHQQERHHRGCPRGESLQEVGPAGHEEATGGPDRTVGDVSQEEHPYGRE